MEIQHSAKDGCLVVALAGSIDLFSVPQVQRALLKDLSEQPFALICDLSGVPHLDPVCAGVFATVVNHPASRWPATSFALCGAHPPVAEILNRLQAPTSCSCTRVSRKPSTPCSPGRHTCVTSCCWPHSL